MNDSITFDLVALECPDPAKLAAFYSDITGWPITRADPDWQMIEGAGSRLCFQLAPDHAAPTWPDPSSSMQSHLDFNVVDMDAAEARVLAAGATKYDHQPGGADFRVYADPAGHPFCLCQLP